MELRDKPQRPKIAWLTPLASDNGVARFSQSVVPPLARLVEVDLWAPSAARPNNVNGIPVNILTDEDSSARSLDSYDLIVYNLGNHPDHFNSIHKQYRRKKGIVILHDKRMHGFFYTLWASTERDPRRYLSMLRYYYGPPGERAGLDILRGRATVDSHAAYPLVEPCLWNALALVVHSQEAYRLVASRYAPLVPTLTLPLAFQPPSHALSSSTSTRRAMGIPEERVLVVSQGGVFPQKRLESVLHAIAQESCLRERVYFLAVGAGSEAYSDYLNRLAKGLGVDALFRQTGFVDDATMYACLRLADICVNLRNPSMESASISLIEQLSFGKPVIVSNTSYYAELPDDVALKVSSEDEVNGLREALDSLVNTPQLRHSMGESAQDFARENHSPDKYAARLARFIATLQEAAHTLESIDGLERALGPAADLSTLHARAAEALTAEREKARCLPDEVSHP